MSQLQTLAEALAIASVGVSGSWAQGRSGYAPKPPKAASTVSNGNSGVGFIKSPSGGNTQSTNTTSARGGGAGKGAGKGGSTTTTTPSGGSTSGSGTTTTTTTTTPAVAPPNALTTKLSKNPQQMARLTGMLPEGMTLDQATTGFRNQGQFIAALNASRNQGVPFADLQQAMTVDGLSLGQAVKQLRNAPPAPAAPVAGAGTTTGGTTTGGTTTGGTTTGGTTTGATTAGSGSTATPTATARAARKAS